ncbi:Nucleotide-binding alpha-beta plait domain containing protein [Parasponia andersonii]|uniref:Nucleotide-binding alpha-beta plait domain containing protein n=1 Tax=Parasponia andersonii TaxID=3476 RepID=A0A2P5DT84_PARAD|nr:Nucleotide-binding alpha-beta plait domain containing protein [Parasponia andersonii]
MKEAETLGGVEFKWGQVKGKGGRKKDVQFYGSFTYDGEEYALYDSVYLYKEGEPEPLIGKLLKIWENREKTKKVKVLWFFRPCEISNYLGVEEASENELFLASGEGVGLCNINPLEAIAGKCNVVCISKDIRNPQPTDEELQMADFVFCRTFDVGSLKVMDKIEEIIAGTDVKCLLNKMDIKKNSGTLKVDSGRNEVNDSAVQNDSRVVISEQNLSEECAAIKTNGCLVDVSLNDAADLDVSLVKGKSLHVDEAAVDLCVTSGDTAETNQAKENVLGHKALIMSKVESNNSEGKVLVRLAESEEKVRNASVELDDRLPKKAKLSSENVEKSKSSVDKPRFNSDANDKEIVSADDFKNEFKTCKDSSRMEKGLSKKLKPGDKFAVLSNGKLQKASSTQSHNEDHKSDGQDLEVTPRPDAGRRKWFKELPWDDKMRAAYEQGTLVLLQNLDPSYNSADVENIISHAFNESCTTKMIQRTMFSSSHYGQAFVIFRRKDIAEKVVRKLDEGCLLLSSGRPLVGSIRTPCFLERKATFFGHLVIDRLRHQMQREQRDAVSTSHCPQPNSYEYDMAMEWCLLQERSDFRWKKLYEKQGQEFKKLKTKLKAR